MQHEYLLSCESTVDMPFSYVNGRGLNVLFYSYSVDGKEYPDDMERDPDALGRFYGFIADGKVPSTSQINTYAYADYFRELLRQGDVLHIAFGSGMTPSVNNAFEAAEQLKEEFPNRRLIVIDSYCSSSGYGLLVDSAADLWDAGKSMDEVADWTRANCKHVHHQFFTSELQYFKRSGRMSGPAATIATILNICPIMRLNNAGRIIAYDKVRGKKAAIRRTLDEIEATAVGGKDYDGKMFICNANVNADAQELERAILERFPNIKDIRIFNIGTIIASHCGPGTVAAFYFGCERPE